MTNGISQPAPSNNKGGSGIIWLLAILLLLLAAGTIYFFLKYSSQSQAFEQRESHVVQLERELDALQRSLNSTKEQMDSAERNVEELQTRITALDRDKGMVADARQALEQAEEQYLRLKEELEACKEAAAEGGDPEALQQAREDVSDLTAQLQQCREEVQELATRLEQQLDCEGLARELDDLKQQADATHKAERIEALQQNLDQCRSQAAEFESKHRADLQMSEAYEDLIQDLKQEIQEKEVVIERFKNRVQINILGRILCKTGSTRITPQGLEVLQKVLPSLGKVEDRQIYVVGHTDDVGISHDFKRIFPTNWELSAGRASAVVRYILDNSEIDPQRLAAVGAANFQPDASNETPEGRASNRRVEIIIGAPLLFDK